MRHTGLEQVVRLGGKPFRLSRYTRKIVRLWIEWAESQSPHPLESALQLIDSLPSDVADLVAEAAVKQNLQRYDFASAPVQSLWGTEDGLRQSFILLLDKFHPEVDEQQGYELFALAEQDHGLDAITGWINRASGEIETDPYDVGYRYFREVGILPAAVATEDRPYRQTDWREIDRKVFEFGFTPEQMDNMTIPEITSVMHSEGAFTEKQALDYRRTRKALTPHQKIELAYRQFG